MWKNSFRFLVSISFILIETPFFLTVLFYNALFLKPSSKLMQRNRALFATLSVSLWLPFLQLRVSTQITPKLTSKNNSQPHHKVFLCTHQSFSDALVLALVFWVYRQSIGPCVALYKRELGKLPILGGLQRYAGNIPVARSGDVEAAKRSLGEAAVRAREGYHVSGFPEGSRRRTLSTGKRDQIQTLKKGFFHLISELAREKPVEVYPVVYVGSYRSWPIGSVLPISGSQVTVRVGDPILVENDQVDMEVLRSQVSDRLETELIMSGSPCVSEAFQRGYEMNFFKIFGVELILSVVPFLGALICYLGS